jgi:hypothetical protein
MLIALNIILAAAVVVGIVALFLHAIHHEHRERLQAAGVLRRGAAATRRSLEHRPAPAARPARSVNRELSPSRG